MNKIVAILSLAIIIATTACKSSGNDAATPTTTDTVQTAKPAKDFSNIQFATTKDTSCGMPLSAGLEDTVRLNGKVYGFCSKECKDDFVNKLIAENKR